MMLPAARTLLLFGSLLVMLRTQAQRAPYEPAPLFDHLLEVNKEWSAQGPSGAIGMVSFPSEADRIAMHLSCTIELLAERTPAQAPPAAIQKRASLLGELRTYAERRQFPQNTSMYRRTPVFVDDQGNRCAVAHLLYVSGYPTLIERIQRELNLSYIQDLPQAELNEWASLHGFSVAELALIQPSYHFMKERGPRVLAEVSLEDGSTVEVVGYEKKDRKLRLVQRIPSGKERTLARLPFTRSVLIVNYEGRVFFGGAPDEKNPEAELYEWNGQHLVQHDPFPGRMGVSRLFVLNGVLMARSYNTGGLHFERYLMADGSWSDIPPGARP
ncbi:MAG: hypothetical protein MUE88_02130 [Flavobacteriales bacterium]|jgi:hypothetical protein|nr:hypothetical protein [Flavobacteriales bacterium]